MIGPSHGQDNINKGVKAVIIGLLAVLACAAIYYHLFGLIADIGLILNLVLLVAVLSLFQATLTMPGIAGMVLTLGMAIDANVLICERIREELRNGSTPLAAIRAGYEKPGRRFSTRTSRICSRRSGCSRSAPARSRASR